MGDACVDLGQVMCVKGGWVVNLEFLTSRKLVSV